MEGEWTLGDIYEEIAEKLASARTKALMGEREEALGLLHGASLEFTRFHEVLRSYPGFYALEHALTVTKETLCRELTRSESEPEVIASREREQQRAKSRKRARRAA